MSHRIAGELLRIGAVVFRPDEPFVWASGMRSPVYVDNRLSLAHPAVRRLIVDGFVSILNEQDIIIDAVVGTATAGIPHAAWLAERLHLPMAYVRGSAKGHGKGNKVEGGLRDGARVVVVEDLVSTGGSSLDAVRTLRETGTRVAAVMAVFSYGLEAAAEAFAKADVGLFTLTDFDTLIDMAREKGAFAAEHENAVREWHARLASGQSSTE